MSLLCALCGGRIRVGVILKDLVLHVPPGDIVEFLLLLFAHGHDSFVVPQGLRV